MSTSTAARDAHSLPVLALVLDAPIVIARVHVAAFDGALAGCPALLLVRALAGRHFDNSE
jgi:hypothetical protein